MEKGRQVSSFFLFLNRNMNKRTICIFALENGMESNNGESGELHVGGYRYGDRRLFPYSVAAIGCADTQIVINNNFMLDAHVRLEINAATLEALMP